MFRKRTDSGSFSFLTIVSFAADINAVRFVLICCLDVIGTLDFGFSAPAAEVTPITHSALNK